MIEFVLGVVASVVAAGIVAGYLVVIRKWRVRRPVRRVFRMPSDQRVVIVVPDREAVDSTHARIERRNHVTWEDMLAASNAERALSLAGIPNDNIEIVSTSEAREGSDYLHQNLIVICSPRANPISKEILQSHNDRVSGPHINFEQIKDGKGDPTQERWAIRHNIGLFESPSYEQVNGLIGRPGQSQDKVTNDVAIVLRVDNPWNPNAKVILIAGVRGIGTWGAAEYVRTHAKEIGRKFGDDDYVIGLKVKLQRWKILDRYEILFESRYERSILE